MTEHDNLFITFESIDGAGGTTLMRAVEHACKEAGYGVQTTAEPSETQVTELIDDRYPAVVQTLLFAADRYLHQDSPLYHESTPIVDGEGSIVLCDRHVDSTFAYQIPQLQKEMEWSVEEAYHWVRGIHELWLRTADLTVFVDTSPQVAAERSLYEDDFEDTWLQQEAYGIYQDLYKGVDDVIRVSGTQPRDEMIDEGVEQVLDAIEDEL